MKKSDLRIGYLCETRSGILKMLMPTQEGKVLIDSEGYYTPFTSLKDDLTTMFSEKYDIFRVWGWQLLKSKALDFSVEDRELLWERKEEVELTLDDIAKKFNIDVSQLKIKK